MSWLKTAGALVAGFALWLAGRWLLAKGRVHDQEEAQAAAREAAIEAGTEEILKHQRKRQKAHKAAEKAKEQGEKVLKRKDQTIGEIAEKWRSD